MNLASRRRALFLLSHLAFFIHRIICEYTVVDVVVMLNRDEYEENVSSLFSVWLTDCRVLEMLPYNQYVKSPGLTD